MAVSQTLDWRRVGIFTPLAAAVGVFLVYGRDLRHKQVMVIAVLLFAVFSLLFKTVPMREFNLPVTTRRNSLVSIAAGVAIYAWFARTKFFQQTPSLALFLLIFIVIEITLILIVRSAANAGRG